MLIIHTALACEAKPWVEALHLKPTKGHGSLRLFQSDDVQLVVSGVGTLRASASMSYLFGLLAGQVDRTSLQAINIGVAGCADTNVPLGADFIIGRSSCIHKARDLFPDIFFTHDLPLATLRTSDRVVHAQPTDSSPSAETPLLWDMEGYGFFSACALFLSPSCMQSIKIVGDHLMDTESITPKRIERLVAGKIDTLMPVIEMYRKQGSGAKRERVLQDSDLQWVDHCSNTMSLTATQKEQLIRALRNWRSKGEQAELDQVLPTPSGSPFKHKRDQRKFFAQLLEKINQ